MSEHAHSKDTSNGSHGHNHGHGHQHGSGNERAVGLAAVLTGSFMGIEIVGGIVAGSLALLADAAHMFTDFASLLLAWWAFRIARKPASSTRTYGHHRFSVLAAFVNGWTLILVAGWVCLEAWHRLDQPVEVAGPLMLVVATAGLVVNLIAFWILSREETDNLNVRAAALHVAGDLLGSVGAIVAAVVIIYTGWTPIDPILSVLVALIILRSAVYVIKESAHILLEGAPNGFDRERAVAALQANVPGVLEVLHVHAWSITQEQSMATLEVDIAADSDANKICRQVEALMHDEFGIGHTTVQTHKGIRDAEGDAHCVFDEQH